MFEFIGHLLLVIGIIGHVLAAALMGALISAHRRVGQPDEPLPFLPAFAWVLLTLVLGFAVPCLFVVLRGQPVLWSDEPPEADQPSSPPPPPGPVVRPRPVSTPEATDPNSPFA